MFMIPPAYPFLVLECPLVPQIHVQGFVCKTSTSSLPKLRYSCCPGEQGVTGTRLFNDKGPYLDLLRAHYAAYAQYASHIDHSKYGVFFLHNVCMCGVCVFGGSLDRHPPRQSAPLIRIVSCFKCTVPLFIRALHAECPYLFVLCMKSVLIVSCFTCRVAARTLGRQLVKDYALTIAVFLAIFAGY